LRLILMPPLQTFLTMSRIHHLPDINLRRPESSISPVPVYPIKLYPFLIRKKHSSTTPMRIPFCITLLAQAARELRALGLKFGQLTPTQLTSLRSLYGRHRLERDMSTLIAAELVGGWTSRQVTSLLKKHRLTGGWNLSSKPCV
jgi:hypothetical protein